MKSFSALNFKEKMEYIGIMAIYPLILLYEQLGKSFKFLNSRSKQITASILTVCLMFTMIPLTAITAFAAPSGSGASAGDPYVVTTGDDFKTAIKSTSNTTNYIKLDACISLSRGAIIVSKPVVVDLNGYTINTASSGTYISGSLSMTFKNGYINAGSTAFFNSANDDIGPDYVLENLVLTNTGDICVYVGYAGTLNATNCSFTTAAATPINANRNGAVFTLTDCYLQGDSYAYKQSDNTLTIDGSSITGNASSATYDGGFVNNITRKHAPLSGTLCTVCNEVAPHNHDGVTFEPWTATSGNLTSGNYCLTESNATALTDNITIPAGETVNLCLNGHTLDMGSYYITNNGTLNICDCKEVGKIIGTIATDIYSRKGVVTNKGTLTMTSGHISNIGENSGEKIAILNDGKTANATITGGKATSTGAGIYNQADLTVSGDTTIIGTNNDGVSNYSKFTFLGGSISTTGGRNGVYNNPKATFVMQGGSIVAENHYCIYNSGGTVDISGGTVTSNSSYGIYNLTNSGTNIGIVTVSGGEIVGTQGIYNTDSQSIVNMQGGKVKGNTTYGINNSGILNFAGGEVEGQTYGICSDAGSINLYGAPTVTSTNGDLSYYSGSIYAHNAESTSAYEGDRLSIYVNSASTYKGEVIVNDVTEDNKDKFTVTNSGYSLILVDDDLVLHKHTWSSDWTSDGSAHWHECTADNCNIDENSEKSGYLTHSAPDDDDDCTTAVKCSTCQYVFTEAHSAHSFTTKASASQASDADCQHKAKYYVQCDNCDVVSDTSTVEVGEFGDHTWDTEWSKDENNHWHKCLISGCTEIKDEHAHTSSGDNVATYFSRPICDDCDKEYGAKLVDSVAPTGEIKIKNNGWLKFWNTVTFGIFCKDYVEITITGADAETDVKSIEYYLSDTAISDSEIGNVTGWQTYTDKINITANDKRFVYAKITDNAGNVTYLSVNGGVVVFTDTEITTGEYEYTLTTKTDIVTNIKPGENTVNMIDICEPGGGAGDMLGYYINNDGYIVLKGESIEAFAENWDIGDYTVTVCYNALGEAYGDGAVGDKITDTVLTLTVKRFKVEKPAADGTVFTYNGSEQTYNIAESEYYTVNGNKRIDAGEQDVTVSLKDTDTFEWADGTTDNLTFKFNIGKAKVTPPTIDSKVYTGEILIADVSETDDYTVTTNAGGKNVGAYDVVLTLKDGNNYKWDATEGVDGDKITLKFQISKAANEWTKTPAIVGWTYGGTKNTAIGTAKFIEGDYATIYYDKNMQMININESTEAGEYYAQLVVEATDNFTGLTSEYLSFTIEKADLTITANPHTITYGDAPANNGVTYSGFVNGETKTVLIGTLAYDYSYAQYGDIGNNFTITPKDVTAANYEITFVPGTLTVNPLEAEIEWSTLSEGELVYDGNANTLTATVSNKKNNDAVSFEIDLTGDNVNVTADGFYYTVTGLTGNKARNYKLGSVLQSPTYKVTKATPNIGTVSVSDPEHIYFNTETGSIVLDRTDESVAGVLKLTAGQTLTVGTRDYDWTFIPNDTRNYNNATGKVSVTVEKIKLDVSGVYWDISSSSFTYDGTKKSVTLVGTLPTGVIVEKTDDTAISAGNYTATAAFKFAEGYSAENYEIIGATDNKVYANWSIAPKSVVATVEVTPNSYTYTGEPIIPSNVIVYDGGNVIPASEYDVAYRDNTNSGTATVIITDKEGGNYTVSGNGSFAITKATPVVAWPENLVGNQGDTLSTVVLPAGFAWENGEEIIGYSDNEYSMIYTPDDTINYNILKKDIQVNGLDVTFPTGEITLKDNKWNEFLNNITFGLFFKETQSITITAADTESGVKEIAYYLATEELSKDDVKALENSKWTVYGDTFNIEPDNEYVVYARITDNAGNVIYINSDGIVLDSIKPVIAGVEDGKDVYGDATFTVDEDYLDTVTLDGEPIEVKDGKYSVPADNKEHTIVVTDKTGNTVTYKLTVYKNYKVSFVVDGKETLTSEVGYGKDSTLPEIPAKDGYTAKWDIDGKNITADTVITAVYEKIPQSPQTGDNTNIGLWVVVMFVSGLSVLLLPRSVKRKKPNSPK